MRQWRLGRPERRRASHFPRPVKTRLYKYHANSMMRLATEDNYGKKILVASLDWLRFN